MQAGYSKACDERQCCLRRKKINCTSCSYMFPRQLNEKKNKTEKHRELQHQLSHLNQTEQQHTYRVPLSLQRNAAVNSKEMKSQIQCCQINNNKKKCTQTSGHQGYIDSNLQFGYKENLCSVKVAGRFFIIEFAALLIDWLFVCSILVQFTAFSV